MGRLEIVIEDRFKGKISNGLIKDLYDEIFYANPVLRVGVQGKGVRGAVVRKTILGLNIVIRMYRRGGLVKYLFDNKFIKSPFLKLKNTRPVREYWTLKLLNGLPVPMPVAVALNVGRFTYGGIIITKEIPLSQSLLESPPSDLKFAKIIAEKAGQITRQIIEKGVFHHDLHVGNVLYQTDGNVYVIDFDGARIIKTEKQKKFAILKTSKRWSRSVNKWFSDSPRLIEAIDKPFVDSLKNIL